MTCSTIAYQGTPPLSDIPKGILALVRLLARDAARADFATCCTKQRAEVAHV